MGATLPARACAPPPRRAAAAPRARSERTRRSRAAAPAAASAAPPPPPPPPAAPALCRRDALAAAAAAALSAARVPAAAAIVAPSSPCAPAAAPAAAAAAAASYDAYADGYDTLNDGTFADVFGPRASGAFSRTFCTYPFTLTHTHACARFSRAGLPALRAALLARASGDVMEIGAGTGLNLPLYRFAQSSGGAVRSLVGALSFARRIDDRASFARCFVC
jgi:hypothetical protein